MDENGNELGETSREQTRLLEAKLHRRRAEEDAQLLANRISLLKQEEAKAWKKIEETRARAKEIMEIKVRNLESQRRKEEQRKAREDEEYQRSMHNRMTKEQDRQFKQLTREQLKAKLRADVEALKESKRDNARQIEANRREDLMKMTNIKQHIRTAQQESEEKRRRDDDEKRARARAHYEERLGNENRIREQKEAEILALEQEEMELIAKLQNTQVLQKNVFEDLEAALTGKLDPQSYLESRDSVSSVVN
jgi:hypothetical protein